MTDLRELGWISRAVLSLILGATLAFVFAALALLGFAFGPLGALLSIPALPGIALAAVFNLLGNGPEQILPILYANIVFYSVLVYGVWQHRLRNFRKP